MIENILAMVLQPADEKKLNSGKYVLRKIDKDSLKKSKELKIEWERKYGFRPTSIWMVPSKANFGQDKELEETLFPKTIATGTYITGRQDNYILTSKKKSLSQFPLELARRIILFWSESNDLIFDPFSGMGERMQVAAFLNRDYHGYDVSKKFHLQKRDLLYNTTFDGYRIITLEDSRKCKLKDESIDMIFTSPPYWNIEVKAYGNENEQLGNAETYEDFLNEYTKVVKHCYRVLKPNKYAIFIVGDFRKNKQFYPFHKDTIEIFCKVGFKLHDIIVYEVGTLAAMFVRSIMMYKRMGKTHEYILVFKK